MRPSPPGEGRRVCLVGWGRGLAGVGWGRGSWGGVGVSLTLAETRVDKNPVSRKQVISKLVGQR